MKQPLVERMQAVPGLSVRIFLDIEPPDGAPPGSMERVIRDFGQQFESLVTGRLLLPVPGVTRAASA